MQKSTNGWTNKFEELLESDDEFPDSYNETPEVPAYLNDNRFESIKFGWIYNKNLICSKYSNVISKPNNNVTLEGTVNNNNKSSYLTFKKGILNKYDIYCLKCVEKNIADNTLVWFVNFLMYKDMQLRYNFLKSCLVSECVNEEEHAPMDSQDLNHDQKCTYRIIVK